MRIDLKSFQDYYNQLIDLKNIILYNIWHQIANNYSETEFKKIKQQKMKI